MLEDIKRITEEVFQLENIEKRTRKANYPRARSVFYFIARQIKPKISLAKIGKFMGNRDHSTVCDGIKKAEEYYFLESDFVELLDVVSDRVNSEVFYIKTTNRSKLIEELKQVNAELREKLYNLDKQEDHLIMKYVYAMNESQRFDFLEYRVMPYAKINKIEI